MIEYIPTYDSINDNTHYSANKPRNYSRLLAWNNMDVKLGNWEGKALLVDLSLGGALIKIPVPEKKIIIEKSGDCEIKSPGMPRNTRIVRIAHEKEEYYIGLAWDASPQTIEAVLSGSNYGDLIYSSDATVQQQLEIVPVFVDINYGVKRYLAKHPDKINDLTPQQFEKLVASILEDLGLDVELTKSTRDGGIDIYAYVRHTVASFLILVECKKWKSSQHVGIEIVQRLYGIQQKLGASKSLIVTTSSFTNPAKEECRLYNGQMDLKDYNDLVSWLDQYIP